MANERKSWIKRGGFTLLLGALLALGFILADYLTQLGSDELAVAPGTETSIGGPFTLLKADGTTVTETDFSNRHKLIFFGFTHCPHVCPSTLRRISAMLTELGDSAEQLYPLFITVDPDRDHPARLTDYARGIDPRLILLTGSPEQLVPVAESYGISYAKIALKSGGYTMDHTAALYLMSPDDRLLESFSQGASATELATTISQHLDH